MATVDEITARVKNRKIFPYNQNQSHDLNYSVVRFRKKLGGLSLKIGTKMENFKKWNFFLNGYRY